MLPHHVLDQLDAYTPCDLPTLHGPLPPRRDIGPDKRLITIYPQPDWVLTNGEWRHDWSRYRMQTYPKPVRGPNGA